MKAIDEKVVTKILEIRKQSPWFSGREIAYQLELPTATVARVLKRTQ